MNQISNDRENGIKAFSDLYNFLNVDGWSPNQIDGRDVYWLRYKGRNGNFICYAEILIELNQFIFYVVNPTNTPEEAYQNMAEFIARMNWGMYVGNFEFDYEDGQIRYKSSLDFKDEMLTDNFIRGIIYPSMKMMDRYLPSIRSIMQGDKTPLDAIQEIE